MKAAAVAESAAEQETRQGVTIKVHDSLINIHIFNEDLTHSKEDKAEIIYVL